MSSGGADLKKLVLAAGGAAALAAVAYLLLREESPKQRAVAGGGRSEAGARKQLQVEEVTKEQVQHILSEIVDSQDSMRAQMRILTKEMRSKPMDFDETYRRVQAVQPEDPLEKCGLSMQDFDQLLNKHQHDPMVRDGIARIISGPAALEGGAASPSGPVSDVKTLVQVHKKMLEELETIVGKFMEMPNKEQYNMKTVTLAAQAVVGGRVEEQFGLTSEDIERAVMQHHAELATDQDFATINIRMQQSMSKLLQ